MNQKPTAESPAPPLSAAGIPWIVICPLEKVDKKSAKNSAQEAFAVARSFLHLRNARGEPSLDVQGHRRVGLSFIDQTRGRTGSFEGVLMYGVSPHDAPKTLALLQEFGTALLHGLEQDAVEFCAGAQSLLCVRNATIAAPKVVLH